MASFDPEKRLKTIRDRQLDFLDAIALFDGRPMLTAGSNRNDEERYKTITLGNDGKFYSIIWTWRAVDRWIISYRRAHDNEARDYIEHVG
jgi:uncharacterized DUF497 family protein